MKHSRAAAARPALASSGIARPGATAIQSAYTHRSISGFYSYSPPVTASQASNGNPSNPV